MKPILFSLFAFFVSCGENTHKKEVANKNEIIAQNRDNHNISTNSKLLITYYEFKPNILSGVSLKNFYTENAYVLYSHKIVTGYYLPKDGEFSEPDSETNYGNRLLLINKNDTVLFTSMGVGDVYLFEPHFYKNDQTGKVIIICQLAFEYFLGGEAFAYENGDISPIGTLDIEGNDEEKNLTSIIEIHEKENELIFTFKSDSLYVNPGSEDILIKNSGTKYIYKDKKLKLVY